MKNWDASGGGGGGGGGGSGGGGGGSTGGANSVVPSVPSPSVCGCKREMEGGRAKSRRLRRLSPPCFGVVVEEEEERLD